MSLTGRGLPTDFAQWATGVNQVADIHTPPPEDSFVADNGRSHKRRLGASAGPGDHFEALLRPGSGVARARVTIGPGRAIEEQRRVRSAAAPANSSSGFFQEP